MSSSNRRKQNPSGPLSFSGVLQRPGQGKGRCGSLKPPIRPRWQRLNKVTQGSLFAFPSRRLPGPGARPPPPARRQSSPGRAPSLDLRHLRGSRTLRVPVWPAGAGVGSLRPRHPLPASPGCSWPCPSGHGARTPSRARHHPAWKPSGSLRARPAFSSQGGVSGHPRIPELDAGPRTRPSPAAHGPCGPGPGARPWPGGPVLRTRAGARPLARGALTHRQRSSSPLASPPPAVLPARRSPPRPGAHSSGPGPGTRGSSARRAWRAPARRARSAGPRARAPGGRAGVGPSWPRA